MDVVDGGRLQFYRFNGALDPDSQRMEQPPIATLRQLTSDLGDGRSAGAFATGGYHSCAGLGNDSVKCRGNKDASRGQVVDETIVNKSSSTAINLGERVVQSQSILRFTIHSCGLFEDGSVTCWGNNEHGQLGTGASGHSILSPQTVDTGDETVTAIDGGLGHSCGLYEDEEFDNASFKCWGLNKCGSVGELGIESHGNRDYPHG